MAENSNLNLNSQELQKVDKFRQSCNTSIITILFTDIVSFTDLADTYGDNIASQIKDVHDKLFSKIIKETKSAEIIKQIGDSFLAVFSEPTSAVQVALEFQKQLESNKEKLSYKKYVLKARIGVHLGQVTLENTFGRDIFGRQVNKTARIMSIARGEQILISESVRDNLVVWLGNQKSETINIINYGKVKLKGIKEKTNISQVCYSNKQIVKPRAVKQRNRKRLVTLILGFFFLLFSYNIITYDYNRVIICMIYDDEKYISYANKLINNNRENVIGTTAISDSLADSINHLLYNNLLNEFRGVEMQILNHENLENIYSISLNDSIKKYYDSSAADEYFGLSNFVKELFEIVKADLILYWIIHDSNNTYHIYKRYNESGRILFANNYSFIDRENLDKKISESQAQDIKMLNRNKSFNLIEFITELYSQEITGRANWSGQGYIEEIFGDKYKIKLLNSYNITKDMEITLKKVFALNDASERKRYIKFLNYNISYLDSLNNIELNEWDDILRDYENILDDYDEDKYINIGNQFLSHPPCGDIILNIEEVNDDYVIATLKFKEYLWITINKEDKVYY